MEYILASWIFFLEIYSIITQNYWKNNETRNCGVWALSWENMLMPYANNKGSDQSTHLCSLISVFVVPCLDSIIPLVSIPEISRP